MSPSLQAVIFVNHWPEPQSSAAGLRTYEVTRFLQRLGYQIVGIAPGPASEQSQRWEQQSVRTLSCDPNQSSTDEVFKTLHPQVVVYDRFYMEEQYGWRARDAWPEALHIVDTSDVHCLRRARQRAVTAQQPWPVVMNPPMEFFEEDILREMASLHRADATLVVSDFEQQWLMAQGLEAERICLLPFSTRVDESAPELSTRQGFCFLGNYLHAPNLDAVRWLETELWPALREVKPDAELHLYGAYPPQAVTQLRGKNGIYAHGTVADHRKILAQHKTLIAALRYGAGVKGKVLEAWASGAAVVGTPIAFEGISERHESFTSTKDFVAQILKLEESQLWQKNVREGCAILRERFDEEKIFAQFNQFLVRTLGSKDHLRALLTGRMLRHHGAQSVRYLSRWIEEKNKNVFNSKSISE